MLQLKIRPGTRIAIGDDVVVEVTRDHNSKMALRILAPAAVQIRRIDEPGGENTPPGSA